MSSAKRPDVRELDGKIKKLWNRGKSAKEIAALLKLPNAKRVYNVRTRCSDMAKRKN